MSTTLGGRVALAEGPDLAESSAKTRHAAWEWFAITKISAANTCRKKRRRSAVGRRREPGRLMNGLAFEAWESYFAG
jgi:hypothetical protein